MDSSSSPLLLALSGGEKCYVSRRKGIKQEQLLFPMLQRLTAKAHVNLTDIERLFIIRGPGRFTGIRIALTLASMMQLLNKTEVYGATLFDVLYRQAQVSRTYQKWKSVHALGAIAVVLHAFREEYFLQIFDGTNTAPQWLNRQELLAQLASYPNSLFLVGTDKEFSPLSELAGNKYALADYKDCRVQAHTLLSMAQEEIWKQHALEPLYLKPARFELVKPT